MKTKTYFLFLLSSTILLTSCLTIRPNAPAKETNIISKKRLRKLIIRHVNTNHTSFDWSDNASDRMIYSALRQSKKPILAITYSIDSNIDWVDFFSENDTLPDNWKAKRDSIITFVWEKEKKYQNKPDLNKRDLLPYGLDNRLALIKIIVTDPSIIRPLREHENVRIEPSFFSF